MKMSTLNPFPTICAHKIWCFYNSCFYTSLCVYNDNSMTLFWQCCFFSLYSLFRMTFRVFNMIYSISMFVCCPFKMEFWLNLLFIFAHIICIRIVCLPNTNFAIFYDKITSLDYHRFKAQSLNSGTWHIKMI